MKTSLHVDQVVLRTRGLTPSASKVIADAVSQALAKAISARRVAGKIANIQVTLPAAAARSPVEIARHISRQLPPSPR